MDMLKYTLYFTVVSVSVDILFLGNFPRNYAIPALFIALALLYIFYRAKIVFIVASIEQLDPNEVGSDLSRL